MRAAAFGASLIAVCALAGAALGVEPLYRPLPETAAVSPLTAVALLLGAATLLLGGPVTHGRRPDVAHALAALMATIGLVALADAVLGLGLDLNRRIFGSDFRTAVTTATALALTGLALTTLDHDRTGSWRSQAVLAAAFALGLGGVTGYAFGVELFSGANRRTEMSPFTGLAICLLVVGAFAARPGRGVTPLLLAPSVGGQFARRAVPAAFAVPLVLGGLAVAAAHAGWISGFAATWLASLGGVLTLVPLTLWIARRLHAEDELRRGFEERLMRVAQTDPLTGLLNRRAFELEMARAAARSGRHDQERWVVCVIDLDRFKELNDRYGHQVGDEALQRIAQKLHGRLRAGDVLARTGGDEFVALLAHADETCAERMAEDLTAAVGEVAITLAEAGYPSRLWASVGVAALDPDAEDPCGDALRRADERMYQAKRAARA